MIEGPTNDNSPERLTVSSAAPQIESLLFPAEADKKAAVDEPSEDADQSESVASEDQSESPEDVEDGSEDTAEGDPDSENQQLEGDDEPEVEEEKPKEPSRHKVKVRGVEEEVTLEEALNGYSRQADYTRSKQELALERAKFEKEEVPVLRERAKKYADGIAQIEETLKAMQPAEPDWDKLAQEAPEDFARQRALWQLNQERLAAVSKERERAQAEVAEQQKAENAKFVRAENEALLELVPEWKDNKVAMKEKAEIAKYVKDLGFSDDDLKAVVKASQMVLLRNAYLYSQSLAKKPAIREKIEKVKAATPGPRDTARPEEKRQERRMQRLGKTGRVEDAAKVLENMPGLLD